MMQSAARVAVMRSVQRTRPARVRQQLPTLALRRSLARLPESGAISASLGAASTLLTCSQVRSERDEIARERDKRQGEREREDLLQPPAEAVDLALADGAGLGFAAVLRDAEAVRGRARLEDPLMLEVGAERSRVAEELLCVGQELGRLPSFGQVGLLYRVQSCPSVMRPSLTKEGSARTSALRTSRYGFLTASDVLRLSST